MTTLLGIYPRQLKTYVHKKTRIWMWIAVLFILVKTWKQPRCYLINKLWYCRQWNVFQLKKDMNCEAMKRHEGTFNAHHEMKAVPLERTSHHLHDIMENTNLRQQWGDQWVSGFE